MSRKKRKPQSDPSISAPSKFTQFINRTAAIWLILFAAVCACYFNTFKNEFAYDDLSYIVRNELIRSPANLPQFFFTSYPPQQPELSLYRPLPQVLYMFNYLLGFSKGPLEKVGLPGEVHSWPFHLSNLLLHWIICVSIFYFFVRLGAKRETSLVAALLFAVHPVHVENVAAMVGAADLLSTLFVILALVMWIMGREEPHLWAPRRLAAAGLFFLALLSKENAIVMPLLAALAAIIILDRDNGFPSRIKLKNVGIELLPFAVAFCVYLLFRMTAVGELGINPDSQYFKNESLLLRLLSIPVVFLLNLKLLIFPLQLCADYNYPVRFIGEIFIQAPTSIFNFYVLLGIVAMIAYVALLCWTWRRHRLACFGLAWYGIALLPTSQVVPFGDLLGERFLYLPSIGFLFALSVGLMDGIGKFTQVQKKYSITTKQKAVIVVMIVIICLLSIRTIQRNRTWLNPQKFWQTLQIDDPYNEDAWYGYASSVEAARTDALTKGNAWRVAGDPVKSDAFLSEAAVLEARAIIAYEISIEKTPAIAANYINLAKLLLTSREPDTMRARALLVEALPLTKGRKDYLQLIHSLTAQSWAIEKNYTECAESIERALRFGETADLYVKLGYARAELQQFAEAADAWRHALKIDHENEKAREALSKLQKVN